MSLQSAKQIIEDIGGIDQLPAAVAKDEPIEEVRADVRGLIRRLEEIFGVEAAYPMTIVLLQTYHDIERMQSEQRKAAGGAR